MYTWSFCMEYQHSIVDIKLEVSYAKYTPTTSMVLTTTDTNPSCSTIAW